MWTPPINESAELTRGDTLVNSLLWDCTSSRSNINVVKFSDLVRRSGRSSRETWMFVSLSSREAILSSIMSCRLFTSLTISYTEFCVWKEVGLIDWSLINWLSGLALVKWVAIFKQGLLEYRLIDWAVNKWLSMVRLLEQGLTDWNGLIYSADIG